MLFNIELLDELKNILVKNKKTVSVAESVTAGYMQAALSAATEASLFFQGGITAYNLGQKTRHLRVEPISSAENDCVSQEVADRMALEVCLLFASEYGISVTGYAKTVPEKNVNEIYAFYAISLNGEVLRSGRLSSDQPEGIEVQIDYAVQIINIFLKLIKEKLQN